MLYIQNRKFKIKYFLMFYSDVNNEDNQDKIIAGKSTESCKIEINSTSTQD